LLCSSRARARHQRCHRDRHQRRHQAASE
jgi:hypothetical protein